MQACQAQINDSRQPISQYCSSRRLCGPQEDLQNTALISGMARVWNTDARILFQKRRKERGKY